MHAKSSDPVVKPAPDDEVWAETTVFLEGVEATLEQLLTPRDSVESPLGHDLWQAAQHTCLARRAKRVRPRLVALFGRAAAAIPVSVASELVHAASLVHDDVIDGGTLRRGLPTVNVRWSNIHAVLCGDLMLSVAFTQLRPHPREVVMSAVGVLSEMSCSAIDEVQARRRFDLTCDRWRAIALGKAGALFGWCGSAAARVAGDAQAAERFERCGRSLGVAFQLADDLKDLMGGDGKDRFADIRNQSPSWPLLWTRDHAPTVAHDLERIFACDDVSPARVEELGHAVIAAGAAEACADAIAREVEAGLDALGSYRDRDGARALADWAAGLLPKLDVRARALRVEVGGRHG